MKRIHLERDEDVGYLNEYLEHSGLKVARIRTGMIDLVATTEQLSNGFY